MNHTYTSTTAGMPCLPPPCPVCGGLECLCRPRFFAGQLLSEEDLRALDHYIIEKNKIHNRYLHGWGVVCGLEVVCHECKGWVTIKSGYALDPCGNDIIVCQDYSFDLCAKIRECCDRKRKDWECEPMTSPPTDCKDVEKCWYVTLRYREFESRGITALKNTGVAPCCPQCGSPSGECHCGCGCGCRGSSNGHEKRAAKPVTVSFRRPAPQCEPTRICESYVVEIAPAPMHEGPTSTDLFERTFLSQVSQCERAVDEVLQQTPELTTNDKLLILQKCLQFKQAVWEFLSSHPTTQCALLDEVREIAFQPPGIDEAIGDYRPKLQRGVTQLQEVLQKFKDDCRCRALLPPCPGDPGDPRVILSCVRVRGADCKIIDICNLRGRHTVATAPNIQYWTSLVHVIKATLEMICCGRVFAGDVTPPPPVAPVGPG